ncbi:DUF1801 domain-containing protein [Candidatus Pacearchaeota archaeon]|nr:DUF1801 domain-containing protein [Candidatus Pacearchaeota archaeon]
MGEIKTKENDASVRDFIEAIKDAQAKENAFTLLSMFKEVTKEYPKMWGSRMIGFGKYHYKSEKSKQEGDWPLIGFSAGKQTLTLYLMSGAKNHAPLLKELGKHKMSTGSCVYIRRLADVDLNVLKRLIKESFIVKKKSLNK